MNKDYLEDPATLLTISRSLLFKGTTTQEIESMMLCLGACTESYPKGSIVFRRGEIPRRMGMVIDGAVQIESVDPWGSTAVLSLKGPGSIFAETYACAQEEPMNVSAVAAQDSTVLMLDVRKIVNVCPRACEHHTLLIRNLLSVLAHDNIALSQRAMHTAPKTIRGKVLEYLSAQALKNGTNVFEIPFNRQQLANYLCVDRSALSAELARMKAEGLIDFSKNRFELMA